MSTSTPPTDDKFWLPSPPSTSSLPSIRQSLASFPSAPLRISRVAQLDASLLDTELEGILHAPVKTALEGITSAGRGSWEPEMLLLLRLSILKMSIWAKTSSTYGSSLQNLRYRNESKHSSTGLQSTAIDSRLTMIQKAVYTALFVLPPYLHVRLQDRMLSSSWSDEPLPRSWLSLLDLRRGFRGSSNSERRTEERIEWSREWKRSIWELLRTGEKLSSILGLVNFLVFLYNGRYRTLVDRVLKMRLVYNQRTVTPNVSFEYLNRQLVWEAFTEFLLFLMPLINLRRIRLRISKSLSSRTSNSKTLRAIATSLPLSISKPLGLSSLLTNSSSSSSRSNGGGQEGEKAGTRRQGKFHFLPRTTCPICFELSPANSFTPPTTHLPPSINASSLADPTNPSSSLLSSSSNSHNSSSTSSGIPTVTDTTVKIPYKTNCENECRYCYYCIVGVLVNCQEEIEDGWECLRCGQVVDGASREKNQVVEGEGEVGYQVGAEEEGEEDADSEEEG